MKSVIRIAATIPYLVGIALKQEASLKGISNSALISIIVNEWYQINNNKKLEE